MATRPGTGDGCPELDNGPDSDWRRDVDTRLSLLASDTQGSQRCAAIRDHGVADAILASMRNADGGSPTRCERQDSDAALLHDSGGLRAGGKFDWRERERSEESSLQQLREIEPPEFLHVPNGYREPIEETVALTPSPGLRDGDEVLAENTGEFDALILKGLRKINEILDYDLPARGDDQFIRMMGIQKDVSVALVNSGLKADENRFRRRQTNILKDLYERMQADAEKRAPLIEQRP